MLNDAVPRISRSILYLLAIIIILGAILAGTNRYYVPEQVNNIHTTGYASENIQTNAPARTHFEQQISFEDFLSTLEQLKNTDTTGYASENMQTKTPTKTQIGIDDISSAPERDQQNVGNDISTAELSIANYDFSTDGVLTQNVDGVAQVNQNLLDIQHLHKEAVYRELIASINQVEGDDKLRLLQNIWQLAPEVGIDENLLTLLHLATYDSNARIEEIANEMLNDLTRFMDGVVRPDVQLVLQITEIDNAQQRNADQAESNDGAQTVNAPGLDRNYSASSVETAWQRNDKINQLKLHALNSDNTNQRDYALTNLIQFDHESALEVIEHLLVNSKDSDERYRTIEKLMASAGEINSMKLSGLLEIAANDYESSVAEYAQASMIMLDQYENKISENDAVSAYPIDSQETKTCKSCGF